MPSWSPRGPLLFVDGRQQRDAYARLAWDDPGLAGGLGAFETLPIFDGQPVALDRHLDRLAQSCSALRIPCPDAGALGFQVAVALGAWAAPEGVVRIQCTAAGRVLLGVRPLPKRRHEVRAASLTWPSPPFPPAFAKHTSRAGAALAPQVLGVDEVFRLNATGGVLEGMWSNVFCVQGSALHTSPTNGTILPGVTRSLVVELVQKGALSLHIVEEAPALEPDADAWFVTSSLHGVVPVVALNGRQLPPPPPCVTALRNQLDLWVGRPLAQT